MNERIISNQVINEIKKRTVLSEQSNSSKNDLGSVESIKVYKLSNTTIKILNERLKDEYYAHYLYRAAANWCHDQNYKKAAAFFDADANTELVHAGIIQKYMTDFNILPEMSKPEPNHNFDNLIDIIQTAYEFELKLMKSYNENSHSVFQDDLTTFDFLQQFRDIQRESVVEFNDLINGSNLVNKKDKFQVLYFENTYF